MSSSSIAGVEMSCIPAFPTSFDGDGENADYQKIEKQIRHNNNIIKEIPKEYRIKKFDIEWDENQMEKLKSIIPLARDFALMVKENKLFKNVWICFSARSGPTVARRINRSKCCVRALI